MIAGWITDGMDDGTTSSRLRELITGYEVAQTVYVAAKLGIADALAEGPAAAPALAATLGADPAALERLMRALATLDIVTAREDGTFALTPLGRQLATGAPGSLRALALLAGERSYRVWGALAYSVTTGRTAFAHVYGTTTFDYMTTHPELAAVYDQAMSASAAEMVAAVLAAIDLSDCRVVVDVGAGMGQFLVAALLRYPALDGVLLDREPVVEHARKRITDAGLAARCRLVAGDFFDAVPAGGDVYLLSHVLHNWDDARGAAILAACREAMPRHGRLLIVEKIVPEAPDASMRARRVAMADLHMMVITGGRERTLAEYDRLLGAAGFCRTRTVDTGVSESVVEARPA